MVDQLERLKRSLEDRYVVERELGRGGMATVFLAYDPELRRRVAIKVLHGEVASAVGVERFEREIRIAAGLTHPRILPVHESGQADGLFFYVMPYVEGESLRARLDREKQLPLSDALRIARQVGRALEYAHGQGLVHRDIKPANVLLTSGGAVVTDFGIARAIGQVEGEALTITGLTVGTPGYMSPEQATGQEEIDGRSDLYSLGCVLYEMLVGEPPFTGRSPQVILARQMAADPSPISTVRPTLPETIGPVLHRLLSRVPADRFRSAGELIQALDSLESRHEPADDEPADTVGEEDRDGSGLRRLALVGSIAGAALLGSFLAWPHIRSSAGGDAGGRPVGSALDPGRIAILEFEMGEQDGSLRTFARNLHERLEAAVQSIEPLSVISTPGGETAGLDSLPWARGAGTIVRPTIAAFADSLEVRIRIVDAATSQVEAVGAVRAPLSDRIPLVDAVADTLTSLLRRKLGPSIRRRRSLLETESSEAFDHVLDASEHVERFRTMVDHGDFGAAARHLDQAEASLGEAERADPDWIEPIVRRARLAERRFLLVRASESGDATRWLRRGLSHSERALERNPDHPQAREIRGTLLKYLSEEVRRTDPAEADRLLQRAEDELRAALQSARVAPRAMRKLSEVMAQQGRYETALAYLRRAYEQDPFLENRVEILLRLFEYSFQVGRDSLAAAWCEEGRRTGRMSYMFHDCRLELMAWTDVYEADPERAWAHVDSLFDEYSQGLSSMLRPKVQGLVAVVLARAGLADSAQNVLERARQADSTSMSTILSELAVLHHTGRTERALDRLERYRSADPAVWLRLRENRRLRALGLMQPLESGTR